MRENLKKRLIAISWGLFGLAYIILLFSKSLWICLLGALVLAGIVILGRWLRENADDLHSWPFIVFLILAFVSIGFSSSIATTRHIARNQKIDNQMMCQIESNKEEENEVQNPEQKSEETAEPEEPYQEPEETVKPQSEKVVTKVVEKRVEVPVEKKVEVPVEVEKKVTEYVEVPVVEYVEVPTTTTPEPTPTPAQKPSYNYTGDPTGGNYGYNYTGDPTGGNYGYGYTGDPTGSYNNSYSVKISGPKTVTQGKSYTYTVTGVSSVSESKLNLPANVTAEKVGTNKFKLYFEEGYTGSYHIEYGSSKLSITVVA